MHRLPSQIIHDLSRGYYTLRYIVNWDKSTKWKQHWLSWKEIGLREEYAYTWKRYIDTLKESLVKIIDDVDDHIIW